MFGLHYGAYSPVVKLNAGLRAARQRSVAGSRAASGSQPASCLSVSLYKEHRRGQTSVLDFFFARQSYFSETGEDSLHRPRITNFSILKSLSSHLAKL